MTIGHVGHCTIHLGGWERYKPLSSSMVESWWRSRGARPLEAPKNLHHAVPKSGSNIAAIQLLEGNLEEILELKDSSKCP